MEMSRGGARKSEVTLSSSSPKNEETRNEKSEDQVVYLFSLAKPRGMVEVVGDTEEKVALTSPAWEHGLLVMNDGWDLDDSSVFGGDGPGKSETFSSDPFEMVDAPISYPSTTADIPGHNLSMTDPEYSALDRPTATLATVNAAQACFPDGKDED